MRTPGVSWKKKLAIAWAAGVLRREIAEDIEIALISLADLRAMVLRGEITDAPSALAILLASEGLKQI